MTAVRGTVYDRCMAFCPNCGQEAREEHEFCPWCGQAQRTLQSEDERPPSSAPHVPQSPLERGFRMGMGACIFVLAELFLIFILPTLIFVACEAWDGY